MRKIFSIATGLLLFFVSVHTKTLWAQTISTKDVKAEMLADWQRAKEYTNEYLQTMPADKYGAKAVDSIRSFAQQMLHLASANAFIMATAAGTPPPAWARHTRQPARSRPWKTALLLNQKTRLCIM